jgi:hypothetical protein
LHNFLVSFHTHKLNAIVVWALATCGL